MEKWTALPLCGLEATLRPAPHPCFWGRAEGPHFPTAASGLGPLACPSSSGTLHFSGLISISVIQERANYRKPASCGSSQERLGGGKVRNPAEVTTRFRDGWGVPAAHPTSTELDILRTCYNSSAPHDHGLTCFSFHFNCFLSAWFLLQAPHKFHLIKEATPGRCFPPPHYILPWLLIQNY